MAYSTHSHVITGAFGYSGRHIAQKLLEAGEEDVRTITGHPKLSGSSGDRRSFGSRVSARPFNFENPAALTESLRGVSVLYNTYWVRFDFGSTTHDRAVRNTKILIDCASRAGVERFVHVSITNPSEDSDLPYFRGKAELESTLIQSGLSYAILRPAVLFGGRDVLINNIAWLLRHFPMFGVPGKGDYGIQPIHVDDLADLALELGRSRENVVLDAVGPETFTYLSLVKLIKQKIGSSAAVFTMPKWMVLAAANVIGWIVKDVVLTREEIDGLMANLLVSRAAPTGRTRFTTWLEQNCQQLGQRYANELIRHFSGARLCGSYPSSEHEVAELSASNQSVMTR